MCELRLPEFRAKAISNHEWLYNGIPIKHQDKTYLYLRNWSVEVDPNTIGQYIMLNDKNDKPIHVGDILEEIRYGGEKRYFRIFQVRGGFGINIDHKDLYNDEIFWYDGCSDIQTSGFIQQLTIVGNVYENKDFLMK